MATTATARSKYPSTPHLPFSPEVADDDVQLGDASPWTNCEIVVTEKLDGANCCIVNGKVFARTHSHEADHASFGPGTFDGGEVMECASPSR